MKRSAVFVVSILGLAAVLVAVPAFADDVLYSNTDYLTDSFTGTSIMPGSVTQSFTLAQASTITSVDFSAVTDDQVTIIPICIPGPFGGENCVTGTPQYTPVDLNSVNWMITDSSSSPQSSGTAAGLSNSYADYDYIDGVTAYQETFSIPSQSFGAGTYNLQLSDAMAQSPDAFWELTGTSQYALKILGAANDLPNPGATPEPSSFLLLGSGLAGLMGLLRRKLNA
jgi:hypothetical protein